MQTNDVLGAFNMKIIKNPSKPILVLKARDNMGTGYPGFDIQLSDDVKAHHVRMLIYVYVHLKIREDMQP
jgi:hypothetical protein